MSKVCKILLYIVISLFVIAVALYISAIWYKPLSKELALTGCAIMFVDLTFLGIFCGIYLEEKSEKEN